MSTGEIELVERRLRKLLDRLATEEDPKQAERLMREHARLSASLGGPAPEDGGCANPATPATSKRTTAPGGPTG